MHVVIINGSPRIQKNSNTDKIIASFGEGLTRNGSTFERYSISSRIQWESAREAFIKADKIIIALPLYVECVPGILLEFLETLPTEREVPAEMSFILQSGFAEACQLRFGEKFLASLPSQFGCSYGGTLVKGDNFGIRVFEGRERDRILTPYIAMGESFARSGNFLTDEAKKFAGLEVFPWHLRMMIGLMFKTYAKKMYTDIANKWGCTKDLKYRPY